MSLLRFIIADDHPLFRRALYQSVSATFQNSEIDEAGNLDEVLQILTHTIDVDLIFLDLKMPGVHGFSGLLFLRGQFPGIPIAIVSGVDDLAVMRQSISYGASGFIQKSASPAQMSDAFRRIMDGETWLPPGVSSRQLDTTGGDNFSKKITLLTPQQFKVLSLMIEGKLNKQISHDMGISLSTVKAHVTAVLKKLGYQRRTQVIAAMQNLALDDHSDTSR